MSELSLVESGRPDTGGALVNVEKERAIQETQASMIIAKKFPRDVDVAYTRIMKACQRKTLAESAMYAYPRGGQMITGASIRLAETIAQNWGNLQFGIRELSQADGASEVEAFAWDIETNTRQIKVFKVPHIRYSKKYGNKPLTDPRDIYEMVANQGARRLRACILGVIPGDIIDAAVTQCDKTLHESSGVPLQDRIRNMLVAFEKFGVNKKMIETRLGHNTDAIIESEIVGLTKIYNSLRDGMSSRDDWFEVASVQTSKEAEDLNRDIKKPSEKPEPPAPAPGPWDQSRWHRLKSPGMIKFAADNVMSWDEQPEDIKEAFRVKWEICEGTGPFLLDGEPVGKKAIDDEIEKVIKEETGHPTTAVSEMNDILLGGDVDAIKYAKEIIGIKGEPEPDHAPAFLVYYKNYLKKRDAEDDGMF